MGPLAHSLAALAAVTVTPLAGVGLALRRSWRTGLRERLGGGSRGAPGAIWIHSASVGEVLAATRLMDHLADTGHEVVASTTSLTGRNLLRSRRPAVPSALAPLDHPWCVEAALRRLRPSALVLVEAELWPSLIWAAGRHDIPVVVVSGRISDRSYPRYRRLPRLSEPLFRRLDAVGVRSVVDAERYEALGTPKERIVVTGNLKLEPPPQPPVAAPHLAAVLGKVPLVVGGSTHEGEEQALLQALDHAERAGHELALALAPRHPERFEGVARLAKATQRRLRRSSRLDGRPLESGEVLLLDSFGELTGLYAEARVAFVGGSLVPRGGHNVLEPAVVGCFVLFGPHTENCRDAAHVLLRAGAARRLVDGAALGEALVGALADPEGSAVRGQRGCSAVAAHRGAARRTAQLVSDIARKGGM